MLGGRGGCVRCCGRCVGDNCIAARVAINSAVTCCLSACVTSNGMAGFKVTSVARRMSDSVRGCACCEKIESTCYYSAVVA
jgi:hypothetical protein